MTDLDLLPDEGLLLQSDSVERLGKKRSNQGQLYLTNRNLIYVSRGFFGQVKSIDKYPVGSIKVVNDQVQVFIEREPHGSAALLKVHVSDEVLAFDFESFIVRQSERWQQAISDLRLYGPGHIGKFENTSDITGRQYFTEVIENTVGMIRRVWKGEPARSTDRVKAAAKCQSCGASLSGYEGMVVRCPYCNSDQTL